MKTKMKALTLVLCAVLLVCASVMGTLAYLKATSGPVQNTFTIGKVAITLDEADVDEYGKQVSTDRVTANEYKLMPGHEYIKDPTVTVLADSEASYIRLMVTVNGYNQLMNAFPQNKYPEYWNGDMFLLQKLVAGWDGGVWESTGFDPTTNTYEFRYYTTVSTVDSAAVKLAPLFTKVVIPGFLTNDQITALNNIEIVINAHAIQADGFADADAAWAQWTN